jgi:hypothetical protein
MLLSRLDHQLTLILDMATRYFWLTAADLYIASHFGSSCALSEAEELIKSQYVPGYRGRLP